jgi:tetratricopeptide (TPR) repeat protein
MKYLFALLIIVFALNSSTGQLVQPPQQTDAQLAITYYNASDFEKAIPLLLSVYRNTSNIYYYRLYITALIQMRKFEEAEAELTREMKRKPADPESMVYLGYIIESQKRTDEAELYYKEAIKNIPTDKGSYLQVGNVFLQFAKYDFAVQTYLKGREVIPGEQFSFELARVYTSLRNYEAMFEEYLNLLKTDETQLPRVQSTLASAMRQDIDNGLREQFRGQVLKRTQAEPEVISYNRLLIWFFLQENKFSNALRQSIALDRRTKEEDANIVQLGQMALNNKSYDDARNAFEYIVEKGKDNPFYILAFAQNVHTSYMLYTTSEAKNLEEGNKLASHFDENLTNLGYNASTLSIIMDYAHLLAFYLDKPEKAIEILQKATEIPRLRPEELGLLKTEMADIYVYTDDQWEATLIYSQVIEANKNNNLGDEVKLKKARLGYYMGNFSWAKAQLDVLKASTSKLTANDAMELSLLISSNLNLDTTSVPLEMFARADWLFFRNKDSLALATLDSLAEMFPYHTLSDNILFRKAKIETTRNNYVLAASYFEQIINDYSYESLADDALFELATLYNFHLNEKEKARDLYKQMLFNFPGSVYVEESRILYRDLRELYPEEKIEREIPKEDIFINGLIPNEIN